MERSKLVSYFGFAKRAGKLTTGVNGISCLKACELLALDMGAAENTKKEAKKLQRRFSCPLVTVEDLGELVNREGCKLAAVRDKSLAGAIFTECTRVQ